MSTVIETPEKTISLTKQELQTLQLALGYAIVSKKVDFYNDSENDSIQTINIKTQIITNYIELFKKFK